MGIMIKIFNVKLLRTIRHRQGLLILQSSTPTGLAFSRLLLTTSKTGAVILLFFKIVNLSRIEYTSYLVYNIMTIFN